MLRNIPALKWWMVNLAQFAKVCVLSKPKQFSILPCYNNIYEIAGFSLVFLKDKVHLINTQTTHILQQLWECQQIVLNVKALDLCG